MSKVTDYKADITARQVLVLEGIEDCAMPPRMLLKWLERKHYRGLKPIFTDYKDTDARKPRGHARRLRCRVAFSQKIVYLPYDGKFATSVGRAAAVTTRSCQGTQAEHVFCLLVDYWSTADVKQGCYVVSTRQKKRFTAFCTHDSWYKWCKNPSPPRNSTLGAELLAVAERFAAQFPMQPLSPELLALRDEEGDTFMPKLQMVNGRYIPPAITVV
jgi:hypothetical protein